MKSRLILFALLLFCTLLVFPSKCVIASNQSPTDKLVTGLNAHMLICSIAEEYEMTVVRCNPSLEGFRNVNKNDLPIESLSVVTKSNNLERWGPRFALMKNEQTVGILQLGVFSDPNSASKIYMDHIFRTSMGPNGDLSNEFGSQSVGWWNDQLDGFTRILFIRDNVAVNISLFLNNILNMGGSANTIIEIAEAIDLALIEGTLGVQKGVVVNVPRILAIEIPAENPARTKVEATVRIAIAEDPNDPNSAEVEFTRTVPFYVPSTGPEDQTLELTYELIYITPGCIVVSQETLVTIIPHVEQQIPEPVVLSEGFETGDFEKFDWALLGDSDWSVTKDEYKSGTYSAQAGPIGNNGSNTLKLTLDCVSGDISFYYKVSSEEDYDYLRFYIDGSLQDKWSGEEDWIQVSFPVKAGSRTFEWTYSKDGSSSYGSDTAWIDDIEFPCN